MPDFPVDASSLLTERLGLRVPIIQAPMAGIATVELAIAVSRAGALGSLGMAGASVEVAASATKAMQESSSGPFQINFFCHDEPDRDPDVEAAWLDQLSPLFERLHVLPPEHLTMPVASFRGDQAMLAMVLELRPPVVSFHLGLPSPATIGALRTAGIEMMATVTSRSEAFLAKDAGIDIVVAQGIEAGGHRGVMDLRGGDDGLAMQPLVQDLVSIPGVAIVAAGGVTNGADIRRALASGAGAVQMGTAFLLCDEAATSNSHRRALRSSAGTRSVMTRALTGRPGRALENCVTMLGEHVDQGMIPDFPLPASASAALSYAARQRAVPGCEAHWAGLGAAEARPLPAHDLIALLVAEMASPPA